MVEVDTVASQEAEIQTSTNVSSNPIYKVNKEDIRLMVVALIIPPVAIWLRKGFFTKDFLINVLFLFTFYIIAVLHAIYVIYTSSTVNSTEESETATNSGVLGDSTPVDNTTNLEQQSMSANIFEQDLEAGAPPLYDELQSSHPADNKIQLQ